MFRHGETAQIAQNGERMLINCVHMKQIVLHLTHNKAEYRQVTWENV
jgi:hypothetical protein